MNFSKKFPLLLRVCSTTRKSVFLLICFFALVNFQPARASLLLGSLVCNGIGLACSYFGFDTFSTHFHFALSSEMRKRGLLEDRYAANKAVRKALWQAALGAISSGLSLGCHALGFWLMWQKIEENRQDKKLTDECVRCDRHQDKAEATLRRLLKKQPVPVRPAVSAEVSTKAEVT